MMMIYVCCQIIEKTVEYLIRLDLPPEEFSSGFFIKGTFFFACLLC